MAVKYTIGFKKYDDVACRIDIEQASYVGSVTPLRQVAKSANFSYDPEETDNPFSVFIPSTLSFTVYNQNNLNIKELQLVEDGEFVVKYYENGALRWQGFLITDKIQRKLKNAPSQLDLSAVCGLSLLSDIPYVHSDLPGGRCVINYARQILFANLGIALPIRWTNTLECDAFPGEDVFSGSVRWSADGQGFYSYNSDNADGQVKSCGEILKGLLQAFQCRIYQANGKWIIRRINDIVNGSFSYKQISGSLIDFSIQSGTENILKLIGRTGSRFVYEDAVITTVKGIKTCKVLYDANIRENILPNGSQDVVVNNIELETAKYWGFYEVPAGDGYAEIKPSLDERSGNSIRLFNGFGGVGDVYYTLKVDGGSLGNEGLPIDTTTLIKRLSINFLFSPEGGFVTVSPEDDTIVWDTEPFKIVVTFLLAGIKYYLNEFGFWQVDPAEINIVIPGLKVGEIAKVAFDRFQGIIMPTNNIQPSPADKSELTIAFRLRDDQSYYLDNIAVTIDAGNDVYESTYAVSKNKAIKEETLKISSSYGGYILSNYMTDWSASGVEFIYNDGFFYAGSLTGMTANAIMRFRYKASEVFNGSILVRGETWSFDQIYLIDNFGTEKFLPLNAKYNIEDCAVMLVACECRNDQIELTEKYYSSNDKPLSN